jgi:hypothetical protein
LDFTKKPQIKYIDRDLMQESTITIYNCQHKRKMMNNKRENVGVKITNIESTLNFLFREETQIA